jgi:hypothetical protein
MKIEIESTAGAGILILMYGAADGFQESRPVISLVGPGQPNVERVSVIDAPHNGEPCTQTSALSCLSFEDILIGLLSTGYFTPHCTTGANECTTLHAQSQHAR